MRDVRERAYRIKPLEWSENIRDDQETCTADCGFGSYTVTRHREDFEPTAPWGGWRWEYCFEEYRDDESFECESVDEGKQKALENWLSRLLPCLIEIEDQSNT